jgi:hypothetical protein
LRTLYLLCNARRPEDSYRFLENYGGQVTRAIAHIGPQGGLDHHPSTGKRLVGVSLPHWEQAVALVKATSAHFPGLRLQNWDVALCPDGPVLVELNTESELAVPQAISGRGLMDKALREILASIDAENVRLNNALRARR